MANILRSVVMVVAVSGLVRGTCYSQEDNPYWYFSAKTGYADSISKNPPMVVENGCKPRLFYLLARHGSRYPSTTDYNNMVKHLPGLKQQILYAANVGRSELCAEDVKSIRDWRQEIRPTDVDALADTGRGELQHLAQTYKSKFPSLLDYPFSKERYLFQSSYMERNIESAKAFASGLFNIEEVDLTYNPKGQDSLLQFYKACNKTQQTTKGEIEERTKFINGPEMATMIRNISKRLGLDGEQLTYDKTDAMYKICVFDRVVHLISPWCAVFSSGDLMLIEYLEDLRNYYLEGPAHQINMDQSCDLMKDMFKYLRLPSKDNENRHPFGVFRFTHSPVINSFYAQLGLYIDKQPLRADNMEAMQNRKWKLSLIDPYSAHIAIIVDQCENDQFKFRTYINQVLYTTSEDPMVLTNMTMLKAAENVANTCNFSSICNTEDIGGAASLWHIVHTLLLTSLCVVITLLC